MKYCFSIFIVLILSACKTKESADKQFINQEEDTLNTKLIYSLHYTNPRELDSCLVSLFCNDFDYRQDRAVFDSLLRKHLTDTVTYYNTLDSLQEQLPILIFQAPDSSFKIYSYSYGVGSQSFCRQYIQYKDTLGNITYKPFYLFGEEGELTCNWSNPMIHEVHPFIYQERYYYILFLNKVYSNIQANSYIAITTFNNGEPEYYTQFFPKEYQDNFCIDITDIPALSGDLNDITPWSSCELHYEPLTYTISYKECDNWQDTLAVVTKVRWKLQLSKKGKNKFHQ